MPTPCAWPRAPNASTCAPLKPSGSDMPDFSEVCAAAEPNKARTPRHRQRLDGEGGGSCRRGSLSAIHYAKIPKRIGLGWLGNVPS